MTRQLLENPYVPTKVKVLEFFRESSDNFSITVDFRCKNSPGQFVMVSLPGVGEAPISICSWSERFVKLNVRQVGSVTNGLARLRKGSPVFVRGPYGRGYPMRELEGNNIVMVGGGCGVAPLKGIIEYIDKNRQRYGNIDLFFGYRSVQDILFTREIDRWKQDYRLMLSIDRMEEGEAGSCYDAGPGFVTDSVKCSGTSCLGSVAFLCGPPRMLDLTVAVLKERGFHSDQIFASLERLMQCAVGKCGHCMVRGRYTCVDGPVFRWDEIEGFAND